MFAMCHQGRHAGLPLREEKIEAVMHFAASSLVGESMQ